MTTMTDDEAASAIRAHHEELAAELRRRVTAVAAAAHSGLAHREAQQHLLEYLDADVLPHARAEESALYPAGDSGLLALLVRAMRDEHVDLVAHVDALRAATDSVEVVGRSAAIFALFESHLHKENELLVPALAADPGVSLGALLGGMHELLG